ncbi:MAG: UDP-N-acetylmuramoyl-tripeptide--D-alanyl-D-alanine ligase [Phycisphaerae bacterium]
MKTLFLDEIRDCLGARVQSDIPLVSVTGVCTDSRQIQSGDIFFAIRGPNFDGHQFIDQVFTAGASGVVVEKTAVLPANADFKRVLVVDDTVTALGKLAAYYRDELACTVIAVTGSNGKTTTKELISHILSKRLRGQRSTKSYNNHIGVPLTILSSEINDEFLVAEVGSNHPGEIDHLGSIVCPDIAVITNIGESHLEGLGSIERVAAEKASLTKHVRSGGAIVVNGDREMLLRLISHPQAMVISFGESENNDMRISSLAVESNCLRFEVNNHFKFELPVLGRHNALNCLAAIVVARRMGFEMADIAEALKDFKLPAMRLEVLQIGDKTVLNDAYNANPASMKSALETLEKYPTTGRRVFYCGQMKELGEQSEQFHRDLGRRIGSDHVDVLIAVGEYAKEVIHEAVSAGMPANHVWAFPDVVEAGKELKNIIKSGDLILVKGSRSMKMEQLIERMKE